MSQFEPLATEPQNTQELLAARTRELSALERAVRVFGATTHPGQDLYRQLTDEAAKLLDVQACVILQYDAGQEALLAQTPAVGLDDALIQNYRIPLDEASPARAGWESGEFQVIRDAPNDPLVQTLGLSDLVRRAGVHSILTVSLHYEDKLLGALQFCNKQDGSAFTADDVRLATIFASQVAVALENARLLTQAQRHAEETASLYEIALALATAADLDETLTTVLAQVRRVVVCDGCFITLATADGSALRICAIEGEGAAGLLDVEMSLDQGINVWIYRQGKPVLLADANTDPRRIHIQGRTEAIRSAVGAPLIVAGQPIGTLYAFRTVPNAFAEADLNFLNLTAAQVAAAVQRVRLMDQTDRRAKEMEIISNVGAALAASLDVDHILQTIYEQAGALMDTRTFFVALYEPERQELHFRLAYNQGAQLAPFTQPLADSQGLAAHIVRSAEPLLIHDMEQEQPSLAATPIFLGDAPRSCLGVPIIAKNQVTGVISAQSDEPYTFATSQLRLLQAISNQAGLSLQNARLFDDLRLLNTDLQEMLRAQAELLRTVEDLASPVVPIVDGVIVLPLVGHVDERRAAQILTTLLDEVEEHRAQVVILDITGVPVINTQVAHHLLQAVRASRLLGAEAILVGIRPDVAQTLVKLGVSLQQVVTRSDLQGGFQYALNIIGQRLTSKRPGGTLRDD